MVNFIQRAENALFKSKPMEDQNVQQPVIQAPVQPQTPAETPPVETQEQHVEEEFHEKPHVEIDPSFNCAACGGEGLKDQYTVCPSCNGTGKV